MGFYLKNSQVLYVLIVVLLFFNCNNTDKPTKTRLIKKAEHQMYQPSEMAVFMNAMYAYNLQLKQQIINGETPVAMPLDLMTLHTAEMTKGKGRTEAWHSFINVFITSQQAVADALSNAHLKTRYNTAINNCLSCHKSECVGPIPKIRKLLIP